MSKVPLHVSERLHVETRELITAALGWDMPIADIASVMRVTISREVAAINKSQKGPDRE